MHSFLSSIISILKHHTKKVILIFCIILVFVFIVSYRIPIKIMTSTTATSEDGEQVSITLNLTFYRYFLKPTEIEGNITVGETTYKDIQSSGIRFGNIENRDFITGIKEKYSGVTYYIFCDAAVSKLDAMSHRLQIMEIDSDAGEMVIHYMNDEESGFYYLSDKQFKQLKGLLH